VLLMFAVVLVAAERWARGLATASRVGSGSPRPAPLIRLNRWRRAAPAPALMVLAAALAAPAFALGQWLLAAGVRWNRQEWLAALGSTVWLSVIAAAVCTLAAVPLAVLAARYRTPAVRILEGAGYVAHGLPSIVVAVAMVSAGVALLRPIYQREPLLILTYAVLFVPLAVGSIRAAVEAAPIRQEEVARSLGRTPLWAFMTVTARTAALVLLTCMKELPATLLLHPTGTSTLATRLWSHSSVSDYAAAAPYAAALVVFAALPTALLGLWSSRPAQGARDA
jgi:iron(III) transport system permease protein